MLISRKGNLSLKSPLERVIEKTEAAGVPVEYISEAEEDRAVFMDTRDESFLAVQQTDEGIEYSMYAPDLTLIDGGVWDMEEEIDLKSAAAEMLDTSEFFVGIPDYDEFIYLTEMNTDIDVPAELAKLKAKALANLPSASSMRKAKQEEQPTVNPSEKAADSSKKEPKSGVAVTYHFISDDVVTGGAKSKFKANVEAIKTLQKIETENRYATPEEQSVMAKYVGWGGIPQAFTSDRVSENIGGNLGEAAQSGWETEQQQLKELLTDDEYKAARASTLTSFYTPPEVMSSVNEYFVEGSGWLDNAAYDQELKNSKLSPKDFYEKVTRINASYVDSQGKTGQIDVSKSEYDMLSEKT